MVYGVDVNCQGVPFNQDFLRLPKLREIIGGIACLIAFFCNTFEIPSAVAQNAPSNSIRTWVDATRLLDSQSVQELQRGEAWLRQALAKEETPVEAAWALALFCVKRDDLSAVDRVIKAVAQRYPELPLPVAIAIERLKVTVALAQENVAEAESAMKRLANVTTSKVISKEDQQLNAVCIGTLIAMLDTDMAQSPLSQETFDLAKKAIPSLNNSAISSQFEKAYEFSKALAKSLSIKFETINQTGIESVKTEQISLTKRYAELSKTFDDAEEEHKSTKRNADDQSKANRVSIKRLQAFVTQLEKNWKIVTPGHPGPMRPAPEMPIKSKVYVDETETRYETTTVTDANGNRVQKQTRKEVRRPQTEIDRERDQKYAGLLQAFNANRAEYDRYLVRYQDAFATWSQADRDRRETMKKEKEDSLQQAASLDKQIDDLEAEKVDGGKQITAMRAQLKQLKLECDSVAEVLRATAIQKPQSSFRPGFFETIFVDQEKSRLLKVHAESIH